MRWTCLRFDELSRDDLYEALALRQVVFCVEQACAYLDCDGVDKVSWHLLGRHDDAGGALVAYARLIGPGVTFDEASIGRIVTHPFARRVGLGRALVSESIARTRSLFGSGPIRIGAQRYLERFYSEAGFVIAGEPYVEDGIPHVEMLLTK